MIHNVDVLLLNFNGADIIKETVNKLQLQKQVNINLIAFDNGSTDGSGALLEAVADEFIERKENGSFTSAYNAMFRKTKYQMYLILSNDVFLEDELTLFKLATQLYESKSFRAIAPRSVRLSGTEDMIYKQGDTLASLTWTMTFGDRPTGFVNRLKSKHTVLQDSCLLIKKQFDIDIFDERVEFYFTEDELCDRLRESGDLVMSDVVVRHAFQHGTNKKISFWKVSQYRSDALAYSKLKFGSTAFFVLTLMTLPRYWFGMIRSRFKS
jgi:GT2 family glycosyltransferase